MHVRDLELSRVSKEMLLALVDLVGRIPLGLQCTPNIMKQESCKYQLLAQRCNTQNQNPLSYTDTQMPG